MKKVISGLIVLLALGFVLVSCDIGTNNDSLLSGTWQVNNMTETTNSGEEENKMSNESNETSQDNTTTDETTSSEENTMPAEGSGKIYILSIKMGESYFEEYGLIEYYYHKKFEFYSNDTFKHWFDYNNSSVPNEWKESKIGVCSWDTDAKTLTFTPQKVLCDDGLHDREETRAILMEAYGADRAYIEESHQMTLEEYIDYVIEVNFAPEIYRYEMEGDEIVSMARISQHPDWFI
jgi:hypothetical protein